MFDTTQSLKRIEALEGLEQTLLRARNEGGELRMESYFSGDDCQYTPYFCGTACCVAGWHAVYSGFDDADSARIISERIVGLWPLPHRYDFYDAPVWLILFGAHRDEGLTSDQAFHKQLKAVRWFLHRERSIVDYYKARALPKRVRREMRLAA